MLPSAVDRGLPIVAALPRLLDALACSSTAIVQAEPGAGKSTVLPLALLDAPWLGGGRIVMLEPRRLAARGVATWMARLLGEEPGETVGYRMRLERRVGPRTRIEVVTEGILTRWLQDDAALAGVGAVLFDEFHERSLHADLGLALCLDAQAALRPELRIVVMSATLDAAALAGPLRDPPVVGASGRSYPVEVRHAARAIDARDVERETAATVQRALREQAGDVLVFLPGGAEIRRVARLLEGVTGGEVDVFSLHGDLPQREQELAIAPAAAGRRKVVLATAIAETSLTIEGVRAVVDAGLARRARFDPRSGMTRLVTTRVSRAAAEQRRGRAGRVAPGTCYRLWTIDAGRGLAEHAPPEILEADLAPLALELAAWGVPDAATLRWVTPPPPAALAQARDLLTALDALDAPGRITPRGQAMRKLGLHPRLAHMLLEARPLGREREAARLAALLEERDLLRLPPGVRACDLRLRVDALDGERADLPPGASVDRGAAERARLLADGWQRLLASERAATAPCPAQVDDADAVGLLLAHAYPDRIAQRRGDGGGRDGAADGRGATVDPADGLARADYLVIADLDGGEREARAWLAAPLSRGALETHLAPRLREEDTVAWDGLAQAVIARRTLRLDHLVVSERQITRPPPERVAAAMIEGLRALGLEALPWTPALRQWQARVELLRGAGIPGVSAALPASGDAELAATLEDWLAPHLGTTTRRADLARLDLQAALEARVPRPLRAQLDALAPARLEVPSGSKLALDYLRPGPPVLAARLQELFGMRETPRVAGGRIAVLVEILSPAGRPVQVTQDLAGFWARGYAEVRKELKGRYPRHYWPDDPHTAVATRRVRPR